MAAEAASSDVIIVGGGIGGSFVARALTEAGLSCLILEAGRQYQKGEYPAREVDANSQLYWGGGMELNATADLVLLRPKVLGGGSVVNQALVDRFDDDALDAWVGDLGRAVPRPGPSSSPGTTGPRREIAIQTIPEEQRNGNARIFAEGCRLNGFQVAPLRRAQRDCRIAGGERLHRVPGRLPAGEQAEHAVDPAQAGRRHRPAQRCCRSSR